MGLDSFLSTRAGVGQFFDDSEEKSLDEFRKNQGVWAGIQTPEFENWTPEDYQYAGDLTPEQAQARTISEDPMTRSAQLAALSKMAGLSETGLSDVDQAAFEKARSMAGQIQNSGNAAALQNAQARGVGGSGLEFVMREQAGQDAAQRAQDAGLAQASKAAEMRSNYLNQYLQGEGAVRGQDYTKEAANTGILNQFNMANTNANNNAQQFNLTNRQNLSNANVDQRSKALQYNNSTAQNVFADQVAKANGVAGANNEMGMAYGAQNAGRAAGRKDDAQLFGTIMGSATGGGK